MTFKYKDKLEVRLEPCVDRAVAAWIGLVPAVALAWLLDLPARLPF